MAEVVYEVQLKSMLHQDDALLGLLDILYYARVNPPASTTFELMPQVVL